MSAAGYYSDIIGTVQRSDDCGLTWGSPAIIWPDHGIVHQTVVTVIRTQNGEVSVFHEIINWSPEVLCCIYVSDTK